MKAGVNYKIEINPHRNETGEYLIIASSAECPEYSNASFFNFADEEIKIEWADWGNMECSEFSDDFKDNFIESLNDNDAKSLIDDFIEDRINSITKIAITVAKQKKTNAGLIAESKINYFLNIFVNLIDITINDDQFEDLKSEVISNVGVTSDFNRLDVTTP